MKPIHFIVVIAAAFFALTCSTSDRDADARDPQAGDVATETVTEVPTTTAAVQTGDDADPAAEGTWYDNWDEAMTAAQAQHKPIYVHFTAEWCSWCRKMETETYTVEGVRKRFADQWITLKVDTEDANSTATFYTTDKDLRVYTDGALAGFEKKTLPYTELAPYFGVKGLPTLLFIDKAGQPIFPLSSYLPADQLVPMLDYFRDELYTKNVNLSEYIEGRS